MAFYYVDTENGNKVVGRFEGPVQAKIDAGYTEVEAALVLGPDEVIYDSGAIVAKPAATAAELLAEAQARRQARLRGLINLFIEQKPDGSARYDVNLKLNLLNWSAEITAIEAAGALASPQQQAWAAAAGPLIAEVKNWITAVQTAYLSDRTAAIAAAADVAAVEALDISYEWFETRYGIAGTVLADPDLYTTDILAAGSE